MKNLHFAVTVLLFIVNYSIQAQITSRTGNFYWGAGLTVLNSEQENRTDSIYTSLSPMESIRLTLLTPNEKNLPQQQQALLSYKRAESILEFCRKQNYPEKEYFAEMVPFNAPHTVRSNQITTRSYKSFMSRNAISYMVFSRSAPVPTDRPSVLFDDSWGDKTQFYSVNANEDIFVTLNSGTQIFIPANSLQLPDGSQNSCDSMSLKVEEFMEMEAMAMKAMTTTSYGKKLQTAGMLHLELNCNGQILQMKPGKKYTISIRAEGEPKKMKVFTGKNQKGLLDWKEETDDAVLLPGSTSEEEIDDENNYEGEGYSDRAYNPNYVLQLNNFGWINCDAFDEGTELTDLLVRGNLDSTNVMLLYPKRKSVLPGYLCADNKTVLFSKIAANEEVVLVVYKINKTKTKVEKCVRILDLGKNKSVNIITKPSTLEELRADIKGKMDDV